MATGNYTVTYILQNIIFFILQNKEINYAIILILG